MYFSSGVSATEVEYVPLPAAPSTNNGNNKKQQVKVYCYFYTIATSLFAVNNVNVLAGEYYRKCILEGTGTSRFRLGCFPGTSDSQG